MLRADICPSGPTHDEDDDNTCATPEFHQARRYLADEARRFLHILDATTYVPPDIASLNLGP